MLIVDATEIFGRYHLIVQTKTKGWIQPHVHGWVGGQWFRHWREKSLQKGEEDPVDGKRMSVYNVES